MEKQEEYEILLARLMKSMGMTIQERREALIIIGAFRCHTELLQWVKTFSGREHMLTAQSLMSQLQTLTMPKWVNNAALLSQIMFQNKNPI